MILQNVLFCITVPNWTVKVYQFALQHAAEVSIVLVLLALVALTLGVTGAMEGINRAKK